MTTVLWIVACTINMFMSITGNSSSVIYDHSAVASGLYYKHDYDHN